MHSVRGMPGTAGSEERASGELIYVLSLGEGLLEVFTVKCSLSSHLVGVFGRVDPFLS